MLLRVALVTEILATIICLYCIYGEKFKLSVKTSMLTLLILVIIESVNFFHLNGLFSCIAYLILCIYCKFKFKSSFLDAVISFILCMVIIISVQFVCMFLANMVLMDDINIRNAVSNILTLIIFKILLPKCELNKVQQSICRKKKTYAAILLVFMGVVAIIMLLQGKTAYAVQMQYFAFAVPAIILLLYSIVKWLMVQAEVEKMEEKFRKVEETKSGYEELLIKVRLRQHELKNHIAAIFSAHYTHKTYEKLVLAQEEYCKKLMSENKYNSLLLLGNNVLVGYLYGKFQEVEADEIKIDYKIEARVDEIQVPTYYVIEMLGIIFDNAIDAIKNSTEKVISFRVYEMSDGYLFSIKNPFKYVSYEEILEWFSLGKSEKGDGRGLGLYHLKCLCEEWKCDIACRNVDVNGKNWIAFTLKIAKADNE